MTNQEVAAYGTWKSPITSDLIVSGVVGLSWIRLDRDDVYWVEMRPAEAGRSVIVRRTADGHQEDINPAPFNARSRVHEYGGCPYAVANGVIYFCDFADQRLYRLEPGEMPVPITPESALRFADPIIDLQRNRLICVCEDHADPDNEPVNKLVAVSLDGSDPIIDLACGADFYSAPRLSPDGNQLAWLSWKHPNMPWDGTDLWLAPIRPDGYLEIGEIVAGGANESIFQPAWSPDGLLYFISDRTGWWNLYRLVEGETQSLCPRPAGFGVPEWLLGWSIYGFATGNRIICSYIDKGVFRLAQLDTDTGELTTIDCPYTADPSASIQVCGDRAFLLAESQTEARAIISLDLDTGAYVTLKHSSTIDIDPGYLSRPRAIEFPTSGGKTAYAFFYPPANRDFRDPADEKPPLLVISHGGPTSAATNGFNLMYQYWTSRGIAVVDVNYGGSTGYGREYRERLSGNWGVVDVDDCIAAAQYLVEAGEVDGQRLAIRGGSAGGYTTLCALTFHDVFSAGCSRFGVADLESLARDTHKFESRYLDRMVGPYPEKRNLYRKRSPIHHVDRLSSPVIFFQGLDDKVVLPNQAEMMVEALRRKGVPVAYVPFAGEGHGFRQSASIKRSLDGELYFYSRIFGFEPADDIEPVEIENL